MDGSGEPGAGPQRPGRQQRVHRCAVALIALEATPVTVPDGGAAGVRVSVRRTCAGRGSQLGVVRLWYDGPAIGRPGTREPAGGDAGRGGGERLRAGLVLSETAGSGADVPRRGGEQCAALPGSAVHVLRELGGRCRGARAGPRRVVGRGREEAAPRPASRESGSIIGRTGRRHTMLDAASLSRTQDVEPVIHQWGRSEWVANSDLAARSCEQRFGLVHILPGNNDGLLRLAAGPGPGQPHEGHTAAPGSRGRPRAPVHNAARCSPSSTRPWMIFHGATPPSAATRDRRRDLPRGRLR